MIDTFSKQVLRDRGVGVARVREPISKRPPEVASSAPLVRQGNRNRAIVAAMIVLSLALIGGAIIAYFPAGPSIRSVAVEGSSARDNGDNTALPSYKFEEEHRPTAH
jgi:hypothetical protein